MNKVILMGRLTRDPNISYSNTSGGEQMAVARYTIAVDRRMRKDAASDQQTADFISCVAFGKNGEFAEKYLKQGTKIAITGRIQTGSYTNKEGAKVYTTDVVVEEHEFCESKAASQNGQASQAPAARPAGRPQPEQAMPQPEQAAADGFMTMFDAVEDEGLPFN